MSQNGAHGRGRSAEAGRTVGWFEAIELPELGIERAFAKLDTGADHSALHARLAVTVSDEGRDFVEFTPPLLRYQAAHEEFAKGGARRVRAPLVDSRVVRSSSGHEEVRLTIRTSLRLGGVLLVVDFTLTDREGMRFPVLLGRSTLALGGFVVDSRFSELAGPPGSC